MFLRGMTTMECPTHSGHEPETGRVKLRLSCKRRQCRPALGDIVGPDMAGRDKKTYGCGSLLALFLLRRRSGSNLNKQPPRLAAQKHDAALWLNVNALIQSRVFLLPTSLIHEKPP